VILSRFLSGMKGKIMIFCNGTLESANMVFDENNMLESFVGFGLYKNSEEFKGVHLQEVVTGDAYETIESLAIESMVRNKSVEEILAVERTDNIFKYKVCVLSDDKRISVTLTRYDPKKLMDSSSLKNSAINTLQQTLREKNSETQRHALRVCNLCKSIGVKLGLSSNELERLELFALLHDIGKITISSEILEKPGKLTQKEWAIMQGHSASGYRILKAIPELSYISNYVLSHHERWDGKGHPEQLKGNEIPFLSRILSVVDTYDAMTNDRPYRRALGKKVALAEIEANAGHQFDPEIVVVFLEYMKKEL